MIIEILEYNNFRLLRNKTKSYLKDLIKPYIPKRYVRFADNNLLEKPETNLKIFNERSFGNAAPDVRNTITESVKASTSFNVFRNNLNHTYSYFRLLVTTRFLKNMLLINVECGKGRIL